MGLRWILVESFDIVVPGFLLGITLDCGLALDPGVLSFGFTWQLHHLFQLSLTGPLPVRGTTSLVSAQPDGPIPGQGNYTTWIAQHEVPIADHAASIF